MFSPIVNNHLFPAARMDHTFTQWQRVGLLRCSDFYIDGLFGIFNDLTKKFNLQRSDLFRYFQVRHFIQTWSSTFPALPVNSELDTLLQTPVQNKGQISVITNTILSFQKVSLDKIRTDWATELGMEISDAAWVCAQSRVNGTSSCARLNLIQFKVFHRIYYTKSKLSKIYPDIDDHCDRCNSTSADMAHMFWTFQN